MPHGSAQSHQPLSGCRIALVGRFASMTHQELAGLIVDFGGAVDRTPSRHTSMLAVGGQQLPLDDEAKPNGAIARARRLAAAGYSIEVISEDEFWQRCHLVDDGSIKRRYTIGQLSTLLRVKRDQLRSWVRAGLIVPTETIHRLAFFDLAQVQSAKRLCEFVKSGHSTADLRSSLEQLHRWLPDVERSLVQLMVLEENGELLVRYGSQGLVEPSGQLRFDFAAMDGHGDPIPWTGRASADELFDQAVELEDIGRWNEAAEAYRRAVEVDPHDAVLRFNLANTEYTVGKLESAAAGFLQAVQIDPEYVEAWNNLGCVASELSRSQDAIVALRRAVELVPDYPDAHFNLADCLAEHDETTLACEHWQRYLELDSDGPWAEQARERLRCYRQAPTPVSS